eukprot:6478729-Pyramimonas_sp.AAC.2
MPPRGQRKTQTYILTTDQSDAGSVGSRVWCRDVQNDCCISNVSAPPLHCTSTFQRIISDGE